MIQDTPDEPGRLIERLVGPTDQELSCEECCDFLDAYVELHLDAGTARLPTPGCRRCARTCGGVPACRDDYDSLLALVLSDQTDPANRFAYRSTRFEPSLGKRPPAAVPLRGHGPLTSVSPTHSHRAIWAANDRPSVPRM